jgi:hypothetical protein
MKTLTNSLTFTRRLLATAAIVTLGVISTAQAAVVAYVATLDGASEQTPNASAGTGFVQVDIDAVAHTMHILATFSGLTGSVTAAHIHAPTLVAGTGTAGVATTTPTFAGFPAGVTVGSYEITLDMTLASSYNASYVTANGGTMGNAEAALFQAIADGKAYFNIHSNVYPAGEIRGFLAPNTVSTEDSTWGQVKALYR